MPINTTTGVFQRVWKFVDRFVPGDLVRRSEADQALDDLANGLNGAVTFLDGKIAGLETSSLVLGAYATDPAPGAGESFVPGNLYVDTDNFVIMVWDGTAWKKQGDLPFATDFFKTLLTAQDDAAFRQLLSLGNAALASTDAFATAEQGEQAVLALKSWVTRWTAALEGLGRSEVRQLGTGATANTTPPFALASGDLLLHIGTTGSGAMSQIIFRPHATVPRAIMRTKPDAGVYGAWVEFLTGPTISTGIVATNVSDGTKSTGTYEPSPLGPVTGGNFRSITNGGAFTLAAPTVAGVFTMLLEITNSASAGAVTFSGFANVTGDSLTTTSGHKFQISIAKTPGGVTATVVALQ